MLPVVLRRRAALDTKKCLPRVRVMQATPAANVNHAVYRMLLTERRRLTDFVIKARPSRAGVMQATLVADVNHAVLRMLLAVRFRPAARHIKDCNYMAPMVEAPRHSCYRAGPLNDTGGERKDEQT